jgi:DNA modification methylase
VTTWDVITGDCLDVLPTVQADSVVCDPPYGLEFMGKEWDKLGGGTEEVTDTANRDGNWTSKPFGGGGNRVRYGKSPKSMQSWHQQWAAAALGALRPGGYMLAFGGTRTFHRLACAIEDAGWEIRDCIMWVYGSGFPKGKGCLKPAWEPVILARKPGPKVLPLQIDACRIAGARPTCTGTGFKTGKYCGANGSGEPTMRGVASESHPSGRWPANVIHDGGDEVMGAFAEYGESGPKAGRTGQRGGKGFGYFDDAKSAAATGIWPADPGGTAARFFYCAKASKRDRGEGNTHPTVKPTELMRYLCRLITPPGGTVLDPFTGSGSTGKAALLEGFHFIGIEKEPAYAEIARRRIGEVRPTDLYAGVPA